MTTTIALGSFLVVLSFAHGLLIAAARTDGVFRLLALTWGIVVSVAILAVAIVAGGAIVRRIRSAPASRASTVSTVR